MRGFLREYGVVVPQGVKRGVEAMREALQIADNGVPDRLRPWIAQGLEEIRQLEGRIKRLEREIAAAVGEDELVQRWLEASGIGLLVASATRAAVVDMQRFGSGREFSSWLGITPREHSSGAQRRLGRISKAGDTEVRTLLIHGARSALRAAKRAQTTGRALNALQRWALEVEQRRGFNKASVALANKLARILWAMAKYGRRFDGNRAVVQSAAAANAA